MKVSAPNFSILPLMNGRIIKTKMSWHLINEFSFIRNYGNDVLFKFTSQKITTLIKLKINPYAFLLPGIPINPLCILIHTYPFLHSGLVHLTESSYSSFMRQNVIPPRQ